MEKAFDQWNTLKKRINAKDPTSCVYFHKREVWWCSVGINVGVEMDGKNEHFERPVLIVKQFNRHMLWAVPLTLKERDSIHFHKILHEKGISYACLSQLRTISSKRLLRKIGMIAASEFVSVCRCIAAYIQKSDPAFGGVLGGRSQ